MKTQPFRLPLAAVLAGGLLTAFPAAAVEPPPDTVPAADTGPARGQGLPVYEEEWAGDRLERVTVRREGGVTEVYRNHRDDTVWGGAETRLGETRNRRQWRVFSW